MTLIIVFGTSTTYGCWDEEGGWVQRLRKYLDKKQISSSDPDIYYMVYNLGISGDTSRDILERIEFETKQRIKLRDEGEEVIMIVSVGPNDSIINNKTKKHHVPLEEYGKNIQKIIDIAKKYAEKIIFVGNEHCNESKVDPIPWLEGHSYRNELIEKYENKTAEISNTNKLHFVDVFNNLKKVKNEDLLPDGIHPGSKGHELFFNIVKDYLIKNKIIL